jgi:hypothetical protein
MSKIFVSPRSPHVEIHINRERQRSSGYWDHPKKRIAQGDATMLLSRFFDWDEIAFRDFRYLQVLITSVASEADIANHWALLDFAYATVFVGNPEAV